VKTGKMRSFLRCGERGKMWRLADQRFKCKEKRIGHGYTRIGRMFADEDKTDLALGRRME
jgi:hypothetical protein